MRTPSYKPAARADISSLLKTSSRMFGAKARRSYKALIDRAINQLCENPLPRGVQHREDLAHAPCTFHLRHARARGAAPKQPRHIIVFNNDEATLTILRVLHDSMDIAQRVSDEESEA